MAKDDQDLSKAAFGVYPQMTAKRANPHGGSVQGLLDALFGAQKNPDMSVLNPQDRAYNSAYTAAEPYSYLGSGLTGIAGLANKTLAKLFRKEASHIPQDVYLANQKKLLGEQQAALNAKYGLNEPTQGIESLMRRELNPNRFESDFYKQFAEPTFYHGSPSSNIEAFNPNFKSGFVDTPRRGATFISPDPDIANAFARANSSGSEATIYPLKARLGKVFDYETPEGQAIIDSFLAKHKEIMTPDLYTRMNKDLRAGTWTAIEDPLFQNHLKSNKFDSFAITEGNAKNYGIFDPSRIRSKFAEFDPAEAASSDIRKRKGGSIDKPLPGGNKTI